MGNVKSIAIDGPAGSGKSSIAKIVAAKLGFLYVDTGALYRTVALYVLRSGVDPMDEKAVGDILNDVLIYFKHIDGTQHVFLGDEDVTGLIRSEEVGNTASKTSSYPAVRASLLKVQKEIVKENNVVMDGRDIGTVIIPDADLKIFLTASVEARADRRFKQLQEKGEIPDIDKIKEDLIIRDKQDTTRETAPLKKAKDAIYLDSSDMGKDEVVGFILDLFKEL